MTAVLDESVQRYTSEPGSGRIRPTVTGTAAGGSTRLSGGKFNWEADLPPMIGGGNLAPSPTAYLLGALAGCAVAFVKDTLAPQFGVRIDDVRAEASCSSDLGGLLGVEGTNPRLTDLAIEITIDSPDDQDRIEEVKQAWLQRCPVYLALVEPQEVAVRFTSTDVEGSDDER